MGIFCSCFRGAEPDDESVDSDDNEQVQGSSNVVNRNAQDNFALFLHNLTNKVSFTSLKSCLNTVVFYFGFSCYKL